MENIGRETIQSFGTTTSQTFTNDLLLKTSTGTSCLNQWSFPQRLEVNEFPDSIEMIYEETSIITLTVHPSPHPQKRYFKIVFSCVDGKWNKSERIYGRKIENQSYFEFD